MRYNALQCVEDTLNIDMLSRIIMEKNFLWEIYKDIMLVFDDSITCIIHAYYHFCY